MAQAKSVKFGQAYVLLGDGGTSETFAAPCGVENLTMTYSSTSNTTALPDCDDVDAVAWDVTDISSVKMVITGSGVLDTDAMQTWKDWWYTDAGAEKNVRFFKDLTALNGGGYYQGPAVLTDYQEQGQRGQRWQQSFTIAFNGKPAFIPAS